MRTEKKKTSFNLTMHTFLSFILMTENILHDTIHQTFRKKEKINKYVWRDKAVVRSFSIPLLYMHRKLDYISFQFHFPAHISFFDEKKRKVRMKMEWTMNEMDELGWRWKRKKVNKIVCEAIDNIKLTLHIPYVMKIDRLQKFEMKPWIKLNYNSTK